MKIFQEYDRICRECFDNDHNFRYYLNEAFEEGLRLNKKVSFKLNNEICVAAMLANFTSYFLRKGVKEMESEEAGLVLDNIVTLIMCIEDKDKYLHFLTREMSKWLLDSDLKESRGSDWDKSLIDSIKAKLGNEFSKNLEAMNNDVRICYEKSSELKKYLQNSIGASARFPDVHYNVLIKTDWLVPVQFEIKPSSKVKTIQRVFKDFYVSRTTNANKNLDWEYFYGRVELKYNLNSKGYLLICKPYQYFVLNLFEKKSEISGEEMMGKLEIKEDQVENLWIVLVSLVKFI